MRLLLLLTLLLPASALAQDAGASADAHFDRDTVVASSAVFRSLSESGGGGFASIERSLMVTDGALAELDLSLALTRGGAVDSAQHDLWTAKLDQRSGLFGDEFGALQEQLTRQSIGYEEAFEGALQRALAVTPAVECKQESASPFDLSGPGGQRKAPKECPGADISADLAKAWDADAELKAAVDAIANEAWTTVTTYDAAEAALDLSGAPASAITVEPAELVANLPEAIEVLDLIAERADVGREELLAARAELSPDDKDGAQAIRTRAKELREWTEAQKEALGVVLFAGLERSRKKKGKKAGWAEVSACLNPSAWGGCDGKDVTDEVGDVLVEDGKLAKELTALRDGLGRPDVSL
ncbi:MAG: hypothetical protein GY898_19645 [Proteobacteria bacterium]|nr:hypothetical protein [Pseudomonadota bacterium]